MLLLPLLSHAGRSSGARWVPVGTGTGKGMHVSPTGMQGEPQGEASHWEDASGEIRQLLPIASIKAWTGGWMGEPQPAPVTGVLSLIYTYLWDVCIWGVYIWGDIYIFMGCIHLGCTYQGYGSCSPSPLAPWLLPAEFGTSCPPHGPIPCLLPASLAFPSCH